MTDLLEWAAGFTVPNGAEGQPRKARFTAATLPVPAECRTDRIRGNPGWRRPGATAIAIDVAYVTADREAWRALGLALLAYALSEQDGPLRIHLPGGEHDLRQIILWPGEPSRMDVSLRMRIGIREVHYRPRPVKGDPNECTNPDGGDFPRDHMPLCVLTRPDMHPRFGHPIAGQPVALHLAGTSPSHVWLGKFLLNLSLDESNLGGTQLYNMIPAESLAPGSAELSLTVPVPAEAAGDDEPARPSGSVQDD
ncbi:MAG TPA: hypothetical protein VLK84_02440 [Longimicrobium sp.]|nr:hypothetical protein [Longimicrobium sp.]